MEQSVRPDAKWVVTFYDPDDEKVHGDTLTGLGIANVAVVRMEQIKQRPEISLAIAVDFNIFFTKFCLCEEFNFEHQL
uniref:hypothetical protein n=1 Tax=Vibrio cholerae TaxID=666 RepID=UPI003F583820